MAFPHTQPSANSSVLHTYKDSQTEARRKTYNRDLTLQDGRGWEDSKIHCVTSVTT